MTQTDIITYNLRERGRSHIGSDRNFDIPRVVDYINGPECQESVRNREMLGYFGHGVRQRYGLKPPETVRDGNTLISIEPAVVTTFLEADGDGTVRHRQEFLSTKPGQAAAQMNGSRTGGFSSVIHRMSQHLLGFDFVNTPNFTTNRAYAFDSADEDWDPEDVYIFDDASLDAPEVGDLVVANDQLEMMGYLLGQSNTREAAYVQQLASLQEDNLELMSQVTHLKEADQVLYDDALARFQVGNSPHERTAVFDAATSSAAGMADLEKIEEPRQSERANKRIYHKYRLPFGVRT